LPLKVGGSTSNISTAANLLNREGAP